VILLDSVAGLGMAEGTAMQRGLAVHVPPVCHIVVSMVSVLLLSYVAFGFFDGLGANKQTNKQKI